jgi:hypothetical protein
MSFYSYNYYGTKADDNTSFYTTNNQAGDSDSAVSITDRGLNQNSNRLQNESLGQLEKPILERK